MKTDGADDDAAIPLPTVPACSTCGGTNVLLDAWAGWSVLKQSWELDATFDNGWCCTCDAETRLFDWIAVAEARKRGIRRLNDGMRQGELGIHDRIMVTPGVQGRGAVFVAATIVAVRSFVGFTDQNDPSGLHEFGRFAVDDVPLYFKIDYYDLTLRTGSQEPADPSRTARVLTIFEPSEY